METTGAGLALHFTGPRDWGSLCITTCYCLLLARQLQAVTSIRVIIYLVMKGLAKKGRKCKQSDSEVTYFEGEKKLYGNQEEPQTTVGFIIETNLAVY